MAETSTASFTGIPAFPVFRELVAHNIGYFPEFVYDRTGTAGHQLRVFRDPPSAEILYSERALVRHVLLGDVVLAALDRNRVDLLTAGLFLVAGGELLRNNRLAGLALVADAYRIANFRVLRPAEMIEHAVRDATERQSVVVTTNLFMPLAHEIGHLPESQALCPDAIRSGAIYETYRINYDMVRPFTGEFDYEPGWTRADSPLNVGVLTEEAASDFFAVAAVTTLAHRMTPAGREYPLVQVASGVLLFPLVMGIQAFLLGHGTTRQDLQEMTLAMQCRYSLLVDSLRACIKSPFRQRRNFAEIEPVIDSSLDEVVATFDKMHLLAWEAGVRYLRLLHEVAPRSDRQILSVVAESARDGRQSLAVAQFLDALAADVHGYSISADNQASLRECSAQLRTFDTIVIQGKNVVGYR